MLAGLPLCLLCHLLQKRLRRRREKCLKILHTTAVTLQCPPHVNCRIFRIIITLHLGKHLLPDLRGNLLHPLHIRHMIRTARGIILQTVLFFQSLFTQFI